MIYGGHFDPEKKQDKINELDILVKNPNFWDDRRNAEKIIRKS